MCMFSPALQMQTSLLPCPFSWMLSSTTSHKDVPEYLPITSEAFGSQLAEPSPVTVTLERTRLGPDDDGRGVESDIASSRRLSFCEVAAFDRHLV
ncbi:hypothetical protein CRV24_002893 [Beauveria bassiana]|nr:hypothetical protein CRV24_002893 [Beauveria bassiana]KAH8718280.1 hypothetical protein HC256_002930 [Beauveria bassiana]